MKHHDGPYRCSFKCGAILKTKFDRVEIAGWMWFTGTGQKTVHVCPNCVHARYGEVRALMAFRKLPVPDDEFVAPPPYPRLETEQSSQGKL